VAQFFASLLSADMLHNVLYDRKNMHEERLTSYS